VLGPGTLLQEKYRLDCEIGRGGMGSVWRATRIDLGTEVAVKVMHAQAAEQADALERFSREAKAAARLNSPHVVRVIDFGVDAASQHAFLTMELLLGESLGQRLKQRGKLSPRAVAEVIAQVARALNEAHGLGIVHRDLKPANVFLVKNEDQDLVKLLDFGIAKADAGSGDEALLTRTGNVLGTPHYMSPEQLSSSRSVDHRADLWSLAVIACECLTGSRPFRGDSLPELAMRISLGRAEAPSRLAPVPVGFDEWFARATQVDPALRFQSAGELAKQLQALLGSARSGEQPAARAPTLSSGAATTRTSLAAGAAAPTLATLSTTQISSVVVNPSAPLVAPSRGRHRALLLAAAGAALISALGLVAAWSRPGPSAAESQRGLTTDPSATPAAMTPPLTPAASLSEPSSAGAGGAAGQDSAGASPNAMAAQPPAAELQQAAPDGVASAGPATSLSQRPSHWRRPRPAEAGRTRTAVTPGARRKATGAGDPLEAYDWQ
jgi:serine/threonine-protein kinase